MSRADGSIIIDTKISDEGIKKGSSSFKKAIKNLVKSCDESCNKINSSFKKTGVGFSSEKIKKEIKKEQQAVKDLQNDLKSLQEKQKQLQNGELKIDTSDVSEKLKKAEEQIHNIRDELSSLNSKRTEMINGVTPTIDAKTGTHTRTTTESKTNYLRNSSPEFQSLEKEISDLENKLRNAYGEAGKLERAIENINQAQLDNVSGDIENVKNQISSSKNRIEDLKVSLNDAQAFESKIKTFSKEFQVLQKTVSSVTGAIRKGFDKVTNGLNKSFSFLKRTVSRIISMVIMRLVQNIMKALQESMGYLAQIDSSFNSSLSNLKSKLGQLKNQIVAAFAPLVEMVAPYIDMVLTKLTALTDKMAQFFSLLNGKNTYQKAAYNYTDYAQSLDDASKNAEKLNKQTASFDELNNLSENDNSSSASLSASDMFDEASVSQNITDLFNKIKNTYAESGLTGLASMLFSSIDKELKKINWKNIGIKAGNGINTMVSVIKSFITEIDWVGTFTGLTTSLNSTIATIDWANVGQTLSLGAITILDSLGAIIETFDWKQLGSSIAEMINNIDWVELVSSLITDASALIVGLLDLLCGFVETMDWGELGTQLIDALFEVVENIDWEGIVSKAYELLGAVIAGATQLVLGLATSVWKKLKEGFENTKSYFDSYIDKAGGNVIKGLFNGIIDALANISKWIIDHIYKPFIDGFCKAFGINAGVSSKLADKGKSLIDGLADGMKKAFNKVVDWFKDKWNSFTSIFSFDGIKGVGDTISGWFGGTSNSSSSGTFSLRSTPIPECATGTVIPARFGKTPVIVGDNNKEAEVISPLSTIKQAVAEVIGNGANEETITLLKELVNLVKEGQTVNLTGDAAKMFKIQKKEEQRWQKVTGKA